MSTTNSPTTEIKDPEKVDFPSNLENGSAKIEYSRDADAAIEKSLLRKLDWNLVPLVSALCMLSSSNQRHI
jgi:hypothetical protein